MARALGKKEQAERTRRRILDAAIKLFAKKGYVSTSMTDLAAAVKMTPGVLYWHFDDKEALLVATLEELERRFAALLLPRADTKAETLPDDPRERSRVLIHKVAELVESNHELMLMIGVIGAETTDANPRIERGLRRAFGAVSHIVSDLLVRGRDAGYIDASVDIPCAAQMFLGLYMGGIMHQRLFRDDLALGRALPEVERMLFGALWARAAAPRARRTR